MAKELLTDVTVRNAKPTDKDQRLNDGDGLYLLVKPNAAKWWRLDYSIHGKRKTLSLGVYPETTLSDARRKATDSRNFVANGIDPSDKRKEQKQLQQVVIENEKRIEAGLPVVGSFGEVSLEFFDKKMASKSESYRQKTWRSIESNLFPFIKNRPIADIKAPELLKALRQLEYRAPVMASKLLQTTGLIFRYAVATGRCDADISQSLKGALVNREVEHYAATTDPVELGHLLNAIESYNGTFTVQMALKLAPILFQRPGELCSMKWAAVDLESQEWRFFVNKTKTPHIVPLPKQAVSILQILYPLTGSHPFVFSAFTKTEHITERALLHALERIGFGHLTMHGLRATARTILDEQLGYRVDFVEHQLAHEVKDPNGRAYNRTTHLKERHKMMQSWADYLDALKKGADVIPFKRTS